MDQIVTVNDSPTTANMMIVITRKKTCREEDLTAATTQAVGKTDQETDSEEINTQIEIITDVLFRAIMKNRMMDGQTEKTKTSGTQTAIEVVVVEALPLQGQEPEEDLAAGPINRGW